MKNQIMRNTTAATLLVAMLTVFNCAGESAESPMEKEPAIVAALSPVLFRDDAPLESQASQDEYSSSIGNLPALQLPSKESWRNWYTWLTVNSGSPYHMVHDVIVARGQTQVMVGKFDYGSVLHKDLEDENVHVYIYGTGMSTWQKIGRFRTNGDGKINVTIPQKGVGEYIVKMVVAGDLSQTYGFLTVVDPGKPTIIFDLDGTVTESDFEVFEDYLGIDNADIYPYADHMVNLYAQHGYQIVYLTGRPYWTAKKSRAWMRALRIPEGILHGTSSNSQSLPGTNTEEFKTDYLRYLKNSVGLNIVRAYGNASTDIAAYENVGIPKSQTYIIGKNAGDDGTVALPESYKTHYFEVKAQLEGPSAAQALPESAHDYADYTDETKTYKKSGALSLKVGFDSRTSVENGYDFIHITDGAGNPVAGSPFTGAALSGASIVVPGDTVRIRLVSDYSVTDWGYKVVSVN